MWGRFGALQFAGIQSQRRTARRALPPSNGSAGRLARRPISAPEIAACDIRETATMLLLYGNNLTAIQAGNSTPSDYRHHGGRIEGPP